jgi:hypothetical protein
MATGYKSVRVGALPSLVSLLAFVFQGCNDGSISPLDDGQEPARGTAIIVLKFTQGLGIDLDRVEIIATAPDMPEHRQDIQLDSGLATGMIELPLGANRALTVNAYDRADELLYTGSGQTDITAGQQVRIEIIMQPVREVVERLSLVFIGIEAAATERFVLKSQIPYVIRIEYRQAITVDLIDEIFGNRVERLLEEAGDERELSLFTRTLMLEDTGGFFLYIRNTSKPWFIEITGG